MKPTQVSLNTPIRGKKHSLQNVSNSNQKAQSMKKQKTASETKGKTMDGSSPLKQQDYEMKEQEDADRLTFMSPESRTN